MAPPPEYDKEPKAPDKSATSVSCEEMKTVCNLVNDQAALSDNKSTCGTSNADVENNKLVETLDDGQLRALLDEAITYKCPKDREGKSNLFKELLEEVEQDEQATEAAARVVNPRNCSSRAGRPSRNRRALPHSNSLQDLVAALAAEPAPRRHRPAPAPVSARALHGGSLPSGVDTSSLGEEPVSGGYLATVRCVNPPPLAERRVSTDSTATHALHLELLNRRSKPAFPMTYTARATLEIGAGAVGAGRAVTTTTASNQVRTAATTPPARPPPPPPPRKRGKDKPRKEPKPRQTPSDRNLPQNRSNVRIYYDDPPQPRNGPKQRHFYHSYDYKITQQDSFYENPKVYSYRLAPTCGPPERLYSQSQRLYNPRGRRGRYKSRREVPSGPDPELFFQSVLEQLEEGEATRRNSLTEESSSKQESSVSKTNTEEDKPTDPIETSVHETKLNTSSEENIDPKQFKLLNALFPKCCDIQNGGGNKVNVDKTEIAFEELATSKQTARAHKKDSVKSNADQSAKNKKRNKKQSKIKVQKPSKDVNQGNHRNASKPHCTITPETDKTEITSAKNTTDSNSEDIVDKDWKSNVNDWYGTLDGRIVGAIFQKRYKKPESNNPRLIKNEQSLNKYISSNTIHDENDDSSESGTYSESDKSLPVVDIDDANKKIINQNVISNDKFQWIELYGDRKPLTANSSSHSKIKRENDNSNTGKYNSSNIGYNQNYKNPFPDYSDYSGLGCYGYYDRYSNFDDYDENFYQSRQKYRDQVGKDLSYPKLEINPRNIRSMTIGKPIPELYDVPTPKESFSDTPAQYNIESMLQTDNKETDTDVGDLHEEFQQDVIITSNEIQNNLESKCDEQDADMSMNISVRSSTPLPEQQDETEIDALASDVKEMSNEVNPKESSVENNEVYEGTVTNPIVSPSDSVNIVIVEDLSSDFCSFRDKDDSCGGKVQLVKTSRDEKQEERELINIYNSPCEQRDVNDQDIELKDMSFHREQNEVLCDNKKENIPSNCDKENKTFTNYVAQQQKLIKVLEDSDLVDSVQEHSLVCNLYNSEKVQHGDADDMLSECISDYNVQDNVENEESLLIVPYESTNSEEESLKTETIQSLSQVVLRLDKSIVETASDNVLANVLAEPPNNAYVFLTLPQHLLSHLHNNDSVKLEIENDSNDKPYAKENKKKAKKQKDVSVECAKKKEISNKKNLRALLFENLFKSNSADKSKSKGMSTTNKKEVDSAIPFSCITTPEVVASCNTTPSTTQSAVAVDPKPLQLASSYRADASLAGDVPPAPRAAPAEPPSHPPRASTGAFNGLPLARPNYGSTGATSQDDFKKSLDENGNSVQGYSSPLSGSSQLKKLRRKKSSKNETVIKSHQIDGYQGNKDLNEVLRFIESNAENSRAGKLGRSKHKDDSDDKGGKKRSTERRKDKEAKVKRATSLEELSRTKLEDLTDKPAKKEGRKDTAPKAERRSWGDDARESFYYEGEPADADFQTVTKKRKPRRRADDTADGDAGPDHTKTTRPPERPRRVSAPPSDRSNDSNDDMDSVQSLPAPAPPAPASYADIARTRHNIPDLIESCNFYLEDTVDDTYPALAPRRAPPPPPPPPSKPAAPPPPRPHRKTERGIERSAECPAPDVVSDRRPPVILLDSAHTHDMDGVTFGFDINEQLLGGPSRRPRCDLVRDAIEGSEGKAAAVAVVADGAVLAACGLGPGAAADGLGPGAAADGAVLAACGLRYVPPPAPHTAQLLQIVHYVGAAWEDVIRCGGGKVRYFSE